MFRLVGFEEIAGSKSGVEELRGQGTEIYKPMLILMGGLEELAGETATDRLRRVHAAIVNGNIPRHK